MSLLLFFTPNQLKLAGVGLLIALIGSAYIKGRFDGGAAESARWQEAARKSELRKAVKRQEAQKEINSIERQLAKIKTDESAKARAARLELAKIYQEQVESAQSDAAELNEIIAKLRGRNVEPEIIEKIRVIRKPTASERNRVERLRQQINTIR